MTAADTLFGPAGRAALTRLAEAPALLSFDLDGTLAPIVAQRDEARVAAPTATLMRALAQRWPVAVVTGRHIDDAAGRLGFTPRWLWGCHGAQRSVNGFDAAPDARCGRPIRPDSDSLQLALDHCREHLAQHAASLHARRVEVEDKGLTIALHYRHADAAGTVVAWLDGLMAPVTRPGAPCVRGPELRAEHGHRVLNLSAANAPDKGDALLDLLAQGRVDRALVIGDDANDEPAFEKAPTGCVTIRIAPLATPTRARLRISSQTRVDALLRILLSLRR